MLNRNKKLISLLLSVALLQSLIIFLTNVRIPIPETLANRLLNLSENSFEIQFQNCSILLHKDLQVEGLKVFLGNRKVFSSETLSIAYNPFSTGDGFLDRLLNVRILESKFSDSSNSLHKLNFREIKMMAKPRGIHCLSKATISGVTLNLAGTIDRSFLNEASEKWISKPVSQSDKLHRWMERFISYVENLNKTELNCLARFSQDSKFSFFQPQSAGVTLQNGKIATNQLCGYALTSATDGVLKITESKIRSEKLILSTNTQTVELNGITLLAVDDRRGKPGLKNPFSDISLDMEDSNLKGVVTGSLPALKVRLNQREPDTRIVFFSDSNRSLASVEFVSGQKGNSLNGYLDLLPGNFNLMRSDQPVRIMGGDKIFLTFNNRFFDPLGPNDNNFHLRGSALSVLGSPPGNFELSGKLLNDFTIKVEEMHGVLGKSEVRGSYFQKWNPHQFRFLLKGTCFPTDVNSWLKDWWDRIWPDFEFSSSIPFGDFSISGEWGGDPGNSITYGKVLAKNFQFREMPIDLAKIEVMVDDQATIVKSDQITHDLGTIAGDLNFPRAHQLSPYLLSFTMDGELPLNDSRKIFGPKVEAQLTEVNASLISLRGAGQISKPQNSDSGDNPSNYELSIASKNPFSFHEISFDKIKGDLSFEQGIIRGHFAEIEIAEGKCSLNFEKTEVSQSNLLDFSLEIKDANRSSFFKELRKLGSSSLPSTFLGNSFESDRDENGKIDLTLQAKGPVEDYLQFEGTGLLEIREKGLGRINLLGNISKELADFRFPIPTGALTFDKINSPFRLEHESIFFDKMKISGPLSVVETTGSFNLGNGEIDFLARLKLIGNLPIPLLKEIIGFADPLSKIAEITISGTLEELKWDLSVNPLP